MSEMKPANHMIAQWRRGKAANDATGNLESMSAWMAEAVRSHKMAEAVQDRARRYAAVFAAIAAIHQAEGDIPVEIYAYRGVTMRGFFALAKDIDPELHRIFHGCL